jgi:hypothetical protein
MNGVPFMGEGMRHSPSRETSKLGVLKEISFRGSNQFVSRLGKWSVGMLE